MTRLDSSKIRNGAGIQALVLLAVGRRLGRQVACGVLEGRGRGVFDGAPQLEQVVEVPLQFFGAAADAGGARDDAHALRQLELVHRLAQFLAVLALDAARDAAATRVVRHQHQIAAGERDEGGERRALVAALFLLDLDDQLLALGQRFLDGRAADVDAVPKEAARDFLERQEAVAFLAVVDEAGFERGFDAGDDALVDVGLALFATGGLDVDVDQLLAVDDRDPQLFGMGRVEQHALHQHSLRRQRRVVPRRSERAAARPAPREIRAERRAALFCHEGGRRRPCNDADCRAGRKSGARATPGSSRKSWLCHRAASEAANELLDSSRPGRRLAAASACTSTVVRHSPGARPRSSGHAPLARRRNLHWSGLIRIALRVVSACAAQFAGSPVLEAVAGCRRRRPGEPVLQQRRVTPTPASIGNMASAGKTTRSRRPRVGRPADPCRRPSQLRVCRGRGCGPAARQLPDAPCQGGPQEPHLPDRAQRRGPGEQGPCGSRPADRCRGRVAHPAPADRPASGAAGSAPAARRCQSCSRTSTCWSSTSRRDWPPTAAAASPTV